MRSQEEIKIELQKKVHRRICMRAITFLTAHPPFYVIFCCLLYLLPFPSNVLIEWPQKTYILLWVVFCVMSKNETILQFNTSCLASLRMWYYFRHFLASVVWPMSHILNCYSFLLKFLSKTKTYNLVVGNCGSSIYC